MQGCAEQQCVASCTWFTQYMPLVFRVWLQSGPEQFPTLVTGCIKHNRKDTLSTISLDPSWVCDLNNATKDETTKSTMITSDQEKPNWDKPGCLEVCDFLTTQIDLKDEDEGKTILPFFPFSNWIDFFFYCTFTFSQRKEPRLLQNCSPTFHLFKISDSQFVLSLGAKTPGWPKSCVSNDGSSAS